MYIAGDLLGSRDTIIRRARGFGRGDDPARQVNVMENYLGRTVLIVIENKCRNRFNLPLSFRKYFHRSIVSRKIYPPLFQYVLL